MDEYEKSTNQVVQTNKIHHTVESLQDYDNNDALDSPEICNAPVDVRKIHTFIHYIYYTRMIKPIYFSAWYLS